MLTTLKALRLKKGITQEELACKAGMTQEELSMYETGRRPIGRNKLEALGLALEMSNAESLGLPYEEYILLEKGRQ